jgi:hypothetical protein
LWPHEHHLILTASQCTGLTVTEALNLKKEKHKHLVSAPNQVWISSRPDPFCISQYKPRLVAFGSGCYFYQRTRWYYFQVQMLVHFWTVPTGTWSMYQHWTELKRILHYFKAELGVSMGGWVGWTELKLYFFNNLIFINT